MRGDLAEIRIQRLLEALERYSPERVYLFGSWARGEADELSDLDVVIIKRTPRFSTACARWRGSCRLSSEGSTFSSTRRRSLPVCGWRGTPSPR
jgi:predicted nucleotidyltransferase